MADERVLDFDGMPDFDGAGDRLIDVEAVDVVDSVDVDDTDILPLTLFTLVLEVVCVTVVKEERDSVEVPVPDIVALIVVDHLEDKLLLGVSCGRREEVVD